MRPFLIFLAVVAIAAVVAQAQGHYGMKVGVVSSDTTDFWTKTGTGFILGGSYTHRLSDRAALQWEVLLSRRGGTEQGGSFPGGEGHSSPDRDPALTYLEFPVSFRYRITGNQAWSSVLYGGACVSVNVGGEMIHREKKSFDAGVLAGWELGHGMASGRTLYLDVRFASGLVDTVAGYDSRSRSVSGAVGVRF